MPFLVGRTIRQARYLPRDEPHPPPLINMIEIEFTDGSVLTITGAGDDCDDWINHEFTSYAGRDSPVK